MALYIMCDTWCATCNKKTTQKIKSMYFMQPLTVALQCQSCKEITSVEAPREGSKMTLLGNISVVADYEEIKKMQEGYEKLKKDEVESKESQQQPQQSEPSKKE